MFKYDGNQITCSDCLKINSSRFFGVGLLALLPHDRPSPDMAVLRAVKGSASSEDLKIHDESPQIRHALIEYTQIVTGEISQRPACGFKTSRLANLQYDLGVPPQSIEFIW